MLTPIKLIECPRDAMQGLHDFIPTETKAAYINKLLKVGFHTLDFGSFVSPKAIPQMRDTKEVLSLLDLSETKTKLLAIVANVRGAEEAANFPEISYLGFPFSISETFQQRNANSSIENALTVVKEMLSICKEKDKTLVVYLSMAFGNPYGDSWSVEILENWASELIKLGVKILSIADTTGMATPEQITEVVAYLLNKFPQIEWGVHLHSTPFEAGKKIKAAYDAGCRRFDSAMMGFGGCPMATDELTGNIATEELLAFLNHKEDSLTIDNSKFNDARSLAVEIFS